MYSSQTLRPDEAFIDDATVDAIAAGGGLSGSAFALELARHGASALIFERTVGPHHKVCGEFLSDRAQSLLHYLGIDAQAVGGSAIDTLCIANGSKQVRAPLPFRAMGISRFVLDETLLAAAERAGAKICRATSVEGLENSGALVRVMTTRGQFQCRAAALASGKHNIRGLPRPDGPMVGFKIHLRPSEAARSALSDVVHLIAFTGGYVGLCLVEGGQLSIAWTIKRDVLRSVGTSWMAQSNYFAQQSCVFRELTTGATPAWEKPIAVASLPYGFMRSETIADSIYPIGDQLGVIPSFCGDGTALALASGVAAAQAVLRGDGAARFQRRMLSSYRPQFRRAAAIDRVIANSLLRRVGIEGVRLLPRAITMLVSATRLRAVDDLMAPGSIQRSTTTK